MGAKMSSSTKAQSFDVLTTTATELQHSLKNGDLTSVQIVQSYLAQIEKHNHEGMNLRAVLALAPRDQLLARAAELDKERAKGRLRGPLHGVPILVKLELGATKSDCQLIEIGLFCYGSCFRHGYYGRFVCFGWF